MIGLYQTPWAIRPSGWSEPYVHSGHNQQLSFLYEPSIQRATPWLGPAAAGFSPATTVGPFFVNSTEGFGVGSDGLAYANYTAANSAGLSWGPDGSATVVNYSLPLPNGTVVYQAVPNFASNDSAAHALGSFCQAGNVAFPNQNEFDVTKHSDNQLYGGWVWGADKRVIVSSVGMWGAGQRIQVAVTWDQNANLTTMYLNGYSVGTSSASLAPIGNTGNLTRFSLIRIGNFYYGNADQVFSWTGAIDWVRVYSRILTTNELLDMYVRPYAFQQKSMYTGPTKVSGIVSRRIWALRTGSRVTPMY